MRISSINCSPSFKGNPTEKITSKVSAKVSALASTLVAASFLEQTKNAKSKEDTFEKTTNVSQNQEIEQEENKCQNSEEPDYKKLYEELKAKVEPDYKKLYEELKAKVDAEAAGKEVKEPEPEVKEPEPEVKEPEPEVKEPEKEVKNSESSNNYSYEDNDYTDASYYPKTSSWDSGHYESHLPMDGSDYYHQTWVH